MAEESGNGGTKVTATFAIVIAVLSIGSCFACYHIGRRSMWDEIKDHRERRRRWEEFDDED
jgi:predicted Co/Zn/Cd cation transporter (cation efflux family)